MTAIPRTRLLGQVYDTTARVGMALGPGYLGDRRDDRPDPEADEHHRGYELDGALWESPAGDDPDGDGEPIGDGHTHGGSEPDGQELPLLTGKGNRRQHRLVAELGQEEDGHH